MKVGERLSQVYPRWSQSSIDGPPPFLRSEDMTPPPAAWIMPSLPLFQTSARSYILAVMKPEPGQETTVVYRHHPLDVALIAVAIAVIAALAATVFNGHRVESAPFPSAALAIGIAILIALFVWLFVWGTMSEHQLDAEISAGLRHADKSLQRLNAVSERLAGRPSSTLDEGTGQQ